MSVQRFSGLPFFNNDESFGIALNPMDVVLQATGFGPDDWCKVSECRVLLRAESGLYIDQD